MLVGLYSAATGLNASERLHEVVAENLAHVSVPGYRANVLSFQTFESAMPASTEQPAPEGYGTLVEELTTDFSPGPVAHTGRTLDVAIGGEGFFVVQGPDGPLYTRNGVFFSSSNGRLVTADGLAVEGVGGPITLPAGTSPSEVGIGADGTVSLRGTAVGRLRIVRFEDNAALVRAGTTLFQAPGGVEPETANTSVMQGSRELANVSAVNELVRMIVGLRHYEAAQTALTTLDQAVGNNTNPEA
jgi:flagellar basal body rod protein FlgG